MDDKEWENVLDKVLVNVMSKYEYGLLGTDYGHNYGENDWWESALRPQYPEAALQLNEEALNHNLTIHRWKGFLMKRGELISKVEQQEYGWSLIGAPPAYKERTWYQKFKAFLRGLW